MFSQVSVCPHEVCLPHCMLGHTPDRYTPGQVRPQGFYILPGQVHPRQAHPPSCTLPSGTPPSAYWDTHTPAQCILGYTPTPVQSMLGYGQQAGGTHPTGMHSCSVGYLCLSVQLALEMDLFSTGSLFLFSITVRTNFTPEFYCLASNEGQNHVLRNKKVKKNYVFSSMGGILAGSTDSEGNCNCINVYT